jgi:transcriptional regulator with XRE-family HTH domain
MKGVLKMTSGEKIRQLRVSQGYTQTDVAKKLGVSTQLIYKYEKEIVTNIPIETIGKLAKIFGVSPAYILDWKDESVQTADPNAQLRNMIIDKIKRATSEELEKINQIIDLIINK